MVASGAFEMSGVKKTCSGSGSTVESKQVMGSSTLSVLHDKANKYVTSRTSEKLDGQALDGQALDLYTFCPHQRRPFGSTTRPERDTILNDIVMNN